MIYHRAQILIADDHTLIRDLLQELLTRESDFEVVGIVHNAEQAVQVAAELKPNILLMDINMPGLSSFDAAQTILTRLRTVRLIFLSAFITDHYIEQALQLKAAGYLTKGESPSCIVAAIRQVCRGDVYFSPDVQARLVIERGKSRLHSPTCTQMAKLTNREVEVLRYVAHDHTKKEIAAFLHLSVKTIDRHTASLMQKLNIHDRVELTRYAIREGITEA